MITPPTRAALPVFTDEDSKPHAGATIAVLAALAQLQHAITQFVAHYSSPWWRGGTSTGAAAAVAQYCGATATHPSPRC